ncbi:hypothetical protein AB0I99_25115 [Streptomyces spongiicola]|uniref:hypothetical protein n=1 Tax=Streptomyces spongiicola TaxID=1690221 RepID=UPI003402AA91
MSHRFEALVVRHTHRIPAPSGPAGDGSVVARQFDAALLSAGFKMSSRAFSCLAGLSEGTVVDVAVRVLRTVREMAGDHVRHNAYCIDFPADVPDTADFRRECVAGAPADDRTRASTLERLGSGVVDKRTLPSYGQVPAPGRSPSRSRCRHGRGAAAHRLHRHGTKPPRASATAPPTAKASPTGARKSMGQVLRDIHGAAQGASDDHTRIRR